MDDPVLCEAAIADALRLAADAPAAWVDAAVLIPSTLGDLSQIERLASDAEFRARFRKDPCGAVAAAGLTPSVSLLAALRERLDG
jgi:hypothetical protein